MRAEPNLPQFIESLSYIGMTPLWNHTRHLYVFLAHLRHSYVQLLPQSELRPDPWLGNVDGADEGEYQHESRRFITTKLLRNILANGSIGCPQLQELEFGDLEDKAWIESIDAQSADGLGSWHIAPDRKNALVRTMR